MNLQSELNDNTVSSIAALAVRADGKLADLDVLVAIDDAHYNYSTQTGEYGRSLGEMLLPPLPDTLKLSTLTGLCDAVKAGMLGNADPDLLAVRVRDHLNVDVVAHAADRYGRRPTLATATHKPLDAFRFDEFYTDPQKFIVAFQASFLLNDPDGTYLLKLASNLTAVGSSVHMADDGINQRVTLKQGEVSTGEHQVRPRLKLIPRRTFDEAAPVESEFLVRLRQTGEGVPAIALFSIDGTKWVGESMRSIKSYLDSQELGIPVIA
ncbi:MAG TPA: hypothetical protein VFV77_01650 [Gammaproteobacteria bacterium]|nr:hypothetical protein [Gammaproteobacteria bacterium]